MEIYGLDHEKFTIMKTWIQVDPLRVRKININEASFKEIMKHPYSSFQVAKALCNFRTRYGKIESIEDIRKSGVLADSTLEKLRPYLVVL